MSKRAAQWVSANLGRIARAQQARMPQGPRTIPETEQMRRFLDGAERWRVEEGLVTPAQWAEYEQEMLRRLGAAS